MIDAFTPHPHRPRGRGHHLVLGLDAEQLSPSTLLSGAQFEVAGVTRGEAAADNPVRPFPTYFRLSANDLVQGPFGARYLVETAGKRRIAVIDDGKTPAPGQGVVPAAVLALATAAYVAVAMGVH